MVMSRIAARISVPPIALALLAIVSMQGGAAFAKSLFPEVGAGGVLFMRVRFCCNSPFCSLATQINTSDPREF